MRARACRHLYFGCDVAPPIKHRDAHYSLLHLFGAWHGSFVRSCVRSTKSSEVPATLVPRQCVVGWAIYPESVYMAEAQSWNPSPPCNTFEILSSFRGSWIFLFVGTRFLLFWKGHYALNNMQYSPFYLLFSLGERHFTLIFRHSFRPWLLAVVGASYLLITTKIVEYSAPMLRWDCKLYIYIYSYKYIGIFKYLNNHLFYVRAHGFVPS